MHQLVCSIPPLQPQAGTSGGRCSAPPTLAAPLLAPGQQRRRSELSLAGRTRRPQAEAAARLGSGGSGGSTAPNKLLTPAPHQQHAQPPRPGVQQQQQPAAAPPQRPPSPSVQPPRQQRIRSAADNSSPSGTSAPNGSSGPNGAAPTPAAVAAGEGSTQLIFRLERRGDGWGEEILPHLVVEQRPLEKKKKRAYSRPDPWKEGSLECYLVELGVPPDDVDRVVTQAVAWRVTPGGRSLIDRRRRSRVERNVRLVVEHLELECGVPFGPNGIAAILARCPEIMLCKPTTNDRWDRRAVELSAYLLQNGHCNVPEDWSENPELGLWVKRQRIARAAGQLSDERLSILQSMGFAFGEVAQLTEEWEHRFDQLVDWMLWHNENQQPFSWLGVDWGARGGITARELALWTTLQREYRARGLLPGEALSRFEAIGLQWDSAQDGTLAERQWMAWFGRLLYLIERHNTLLQQPRRSQLLNGRPKMGRPRGGSSGGSAAAAAAGRSGASGGGGEGDEGGPSSSPTNSSSGGADLGEDSDDEEAEPPLGPGGRRGSAAVAAARQRLQEEVAARRAALAAADLRSEPGLRFWLERQRRRWRRQELPAEQGLMLQLAGVQLDCYSPFEWQAVAHLTAGVLQGSQVTLDLAGAAQRAQQAGAAPAAAAAHTGAAAAGAAGDGEPGSQQQQQQQQAGRARRREPAAPSPLQRRPAGSMRMRVSRWVQTQQALFAEGKLSAAQLRYMAFLGITWVLSDEVTHMGQAAWQQRCQQLAAAPRPLPRRGELWQWQEHQKGLHALGWLPPQRQRALEALQVQLHAFDRCPEDADWDRRLSELLAYKAEHGHCRLPPPPAAAGAHADAAGPRGAEPNGAAAAQQQQRLAGLAAWLAEQHRLAAAGRLPAQRAAQLASSTKRRLFAAEECEGCDAAAPSTSAPETFFGRQDSSTSTLTCLDAAPSEEAAGPSTPEQGVAGRRSSAAAGFHSLEAPLLYALQAWRQQLVALQPLVQIEDSVLLGAVELVRELAASRPDLAPTLHASVPHLYTYLAAALWLAAKLCGVRTSIPNRSLMSQATRVDAQALSDFELDLLFSLDWDAAGVLARQGLLC
ncbi:hypothetical protein ABPG75_005133 [Micractinium tetrahymenae]